MTTIYEEVAIGIGCFGFTTGGRMKFDLTWQGEKVGSGGASAWQDDKHWGWLSDPFVYGFHGKLSYLAVPNVTQRITGTLRIGSEFWSDVRTGEFSFNITETTPPPPPECPPGQHWDETQEKCVPDLPPHECPPGQHWDEAQQACVPDVPPTGPPNPPNTLNPLDWLKWIGQIIIWFLGEIWKGLFKILQDFILWVWNQIPKSTRDSINGMILSFSLVRTALLRPQRIPEKMIEGIYAAKSPQVLESMTKTIAEGTKETVKLNQLWLWDLLDDFILNQVLPDIKKIRAETDADLDSPALTEKEIIDNALDRIGKIYTHFFVNSWLWELCTAGQIEALTNLFSAALAWTGLDRIVNLRFDAKIESRLQPKTQREIDKQFKAKYFPLQDYQRMVVREKILLEKFYEITDEMGISRDHAEKFWSAHYDPPTLDDIITYNKRYPEKALPFERISIISDIDPEFQEIFEERFWVDPTMMEARYMFELGAATIEECDDILRRNRFKPEDRKRLLTWIERFQLRRWQFRRITSLISKFVADKAKETDIETFCKTIPMTDEAIKVVIDIAKDRKELAGAPSKEGRAIAPGTLDDMLYEEIIDSEDVDSELETQGYKGDQKEWMKSLIEKNVENLVGHAPMSFWLDAYRFGEKTKEEVTSFLSLLIDDASEIDMVLRVVEDRVKARGGPFPERYS